MKYINNNWNSNKLLYLNKKVLFDDIKCHFHSQEVQFSMFKICIELTTYGIKNIEHILKEIYSVIIYIRENLSLEQILQDYNRFQREQYHNFIDESPNNQILDNYINYKLMPKYVIINNIETNKINENVLDTILSEIGPENMLILINTIKFNKLFVNLKYNNKIVQKYKSLTNSEFNKKHLKIENYTKMKYYITDIDKSLIKQFEKNEIIRFYENEYSSNKMILVLTSNKSIDELTSLTIKYFSKIQNKQLNLKTFDEEPISNHTHPFEYLKKKIIFTESTKNKNLIT
ncbi:hypothetical protein cmbei_5005515, partial [Cryptosporidium meleagridis]